MADKKTVSQEEKIWGAISYLWVLSVVALAARKNNEFIRFHANQGLILFVISVVVMILPPLGMLLNIIVAIAVIVGIIKALQGEKWELPLLADAAKKLGDWLIKTVKL